MLATYLTRRWPVSDLLDVQKTMLNVRTLTKRGLCYVCICGQTVTDIPKFGFDNTLNTTTVIFSTSFLSKTHRVELIIYSKGKLKSYV